MTKSPNSSNDLNEQRRRAVQLRLAGKTLSEVRDEVGLSAPTIVAAVKAFKSGGWAAVDVKPRGRPRRSESGASTTEKARAALLKHFLAEPDTLWASSSVRDWLQQTQKLDVSVQTAANYLQSWNWQPENQLRRCTESPSTAVQTWVAGKYEDFKASAKNQKATLLWLGTRVVDSEFTQLYVHTLRGRCLWMCSKNAPTRNNYQQFLDQLINEFSNGIALVLPNKTMQSEVERYINQGNSKVICTLAPSNVASFADNVTSNSSERTTSSKKDTSTASGSIDSSSGNSVSDSVSKSTGRKVASITTAHKHKTTNSVNASTPGNGRDILENKNTKQRAIPTRKKRVSKQLSTDKHQPVSQQVSQDQPAIKPTLFKQSNNLQAVKGQTMNQPAVGNAANDAVTERASALPSGEHGLTHLQRLEAESIQIIREVAANAENPVMMYSIGKDSAVMMHLARKAFFPAKAPFPLLHVDTTWKFQEMYSFRDEIVKEYGFELLTHTNPEGLEKGVNPFTHGSALHTDIMKTEALKQALDKHKFDVALGGARRDEEKSRAKERVFSFRSAQHRWEPKSQRPELWNLYNTRKHPGESLRTFPLSNWTELDIWQYIYLQNIPIVPLYFAAERPVVERDGTLIMVDDDRMPLNDGEVPMMRNVRFRTLGCYPLTGAIESNATTLLDIIQETLLATNSERQGRMIDSDSAASMEKKKQEGYF